MGLVIALSSPGHLHLTHHHRPHRSASPSRITRQVFRSRWRLAWCIAGYESGHQLDPPHNNSARGPWQIEPSAHPWVSVYRLTHDWRYSAIAASRISKHGTDWSQWTTHSLCGV